ncbi:ABC transporter ATP-binding protein [Desulfohalobium retbaense]|uniref:ABC transporter related protein n=1 Tax=Desulfohalobium retbaense (strain ATCC 49708 / DSM 5692 / JCM 16813 / HR100) TaxID=485915 RepID=C8X5I1_DESRD|nr:ATP-binding cassette domain-containing protein [Desulfohalobium retbaense]ACV69678.1 ABC transporter related protein [Desulfohalobium retbaense DSM 5692]
MLFVGRHIRKTFGQRRVLDLERFALEPGRIHGLLGPNGAGKTTLLHILSFLDRPTSGTLFYDGQPVDFQSQNQLRRLRREVILVDQHPILFTTSVEANVGYGLKVRGVPKTKRRRLVEQSLELVGMRKFLQARAWRLSGGETQRVALARALACSPRVLCLDEPTASVDVEHQIALERIVQDIHAETGMTIILCTHDQRLAAKLVQNTLYLFDGRASRSLYENVFSGQVLTGEDGVSQCQLGANLSLPVSCDDATHLKISLNPKALELLEGAAEPHPDSRYWPGRITQISDAGKHIRFQVDVGLPINVLYKKATPELDKWWIGRETVLRIPSRAVHIL